jgi:molybdopterin-guanine dinucleotide biosynthesis protein B
MPETRGSWAGAVAAIAIVGHKNSGKTTLTVRLIAELTAAGFCVAAVKHTSDERGFDKPDTDSDRFRAAGAVAVGLIARNEVGFYTDHTAATGGAWIEGLLASLPRAPDLLIYEGHRTGLHPKIECMRKPELTTPTLGVEQRLVAVVSDHAIHAPVPVFAFEPIGPLAAFVVGLTRPRRSSKLSECLIAPEPG